MKLLSWFFSDKSNPDNAADIGETVGVLSTTPENLAKELSEIKAESDKRLADLHESHKIALAEAKGQVQALADQLEQKGASYRSLLATIEAKDDEIAARDAQIAKLEEDVATESKSADDKAKAKLRQLGHSPVAIDTSHEGTLSEKYLSLKPGKERLEFLKQNKAGLEAEWGKSTSKITL